MSDYYGWDKEQKTQYVHDLEQEIAQSRLDKLKNKK